MDGSRPDQKHWLETAVIKQMKESAAEPENGHFRIIGKDSQKPKAQSETDNAEIFYTGINRQTFDVFPVQGKSRKNKTSACACNPENPSCAGGNFGEKCYF